MLVTGGAGGLGKVIATAYLEAGANVAVCDVNEERLSAAREELGSGATTERFLAVQTDITDEEAVDALAADVVARFGRLDILVNNAGIMDIFDPVGDLTKGRWDKVLAVNLTGSFLCMRAAVRAFEKQQPVGGTIIQIGSAASNLGSCAGAAYTVSKHGVAGLVKNTADFYGDRGIYAVGLMLGGMAETNIADAAGGFGGFNRDAYARASAALTFKPDEHNVPLRDVAKYCVFLADRSIAATANGSCVPFARNWPKA